MIVIRESCVPPTTSHHAKKVSTFGGRARLYDSARLVAAKSFWDALFLPHRPEAPLEGPLVLDVELRWPHTKGTAKRDLGRELPFTARPDLDNCAKGLTDSLARCAFFANDSQIVDLRLRKYRSPRPGVVVRLGRLA